MQAINVLLNFTCNGDFNLLWKNGLAVPIIVNDICTPTPKGAFQTLLVCEYLIIPTASVLEMGNLF